MLSYFRVLGLVRADVVLVQREGLRTERGQSYSRTAAYILPFPENCKTIFLEQKKPTETKMAEKNLRQVKTDHIRMCIILDRRPRPHRRVSSWCLGASAVPSVFASRTHVSGDVHNNICWPCTHCTYRGNEAILLCAMAISLDVTD